MNRPIVPAPIQGRLNSIDFARGLIMLIMAIDHSRDLLHSDSLTHDPLDFATTSPALFLTRWITHLCAPTFVFLAGTSAYLMLKAQNNLPQTRRFLWTRGLWLIVLELTVIGFGIWFDVFFRTLLLQVIFAIGAGFVILSTLIKLNWKAIGALGLLIIFLHDALPQSLGSGQPLLDGTFTVLFNRGNFMLGPGRSLYVAYAVIPWLGIMLLGFAFGRVFEKEPAQRHKLLLVSSGIALLLFIVLRLANAYGDRTPWSLQNTGFYSLLSFINVSKYPPSLLYTAVTLSFAFIILALAETAGNRFTRMVITYGRVPMFFYILHWYIIHITMFVLIRIQGVQWQDMPIGNFNFGRPAAGVGVSLTYVYLFWLLLILSLYPLCRWYGSYKAANKHKKWLSYL